MKKCNKCHEDKDISEFRIRKNGRVEAVCKRCEVDYALNYRKMEPRQEWEKRYKVSQARKEIKRQYNQRNYNRDFDKIMARRAVFYAIRHNEIAPVSSLTCSQCSNQARHYHHHNGYNKEHWLDVVPVCIDCHKD